MSYAFCHRILQGLWAAGVRDIVVTPGSRSTPLLLAALDSEMHLHRTIDERSAAFFALGRARARTCKVALLCTSGSAGAHYLPALLEARYAGHHVIALTADRPAELRHTGANQTIDQRQLFSAACPPCLDISAQDDDAIAASIDVYEAAISARGPLHVNLAFRKPLEPGPGESIPTPAEFPTRSTGPIPEVRKIEELILHIQNTSRGVIVAGPSYRENMGPALSRLAKSLGFVLLAESTSGARFTGSEQPQRIDFFGHILERESWACELEPELILQFGADPACGSLLRWLGGSGAKRVRFGEHHVLRDPTNSIELIGGDGLAHCEAIATRAKSTATDAYLSTWKKADAQCSERVQAALSSDEAPLGEASAIASVLHCLPADTQLTIGNSLPIRGVDAVVPGSRVRLNVLHQRGTSGIEGLIAGALGSSGSKLSALLIGDVSCVHDIGSLALHPNADGPVLIVVIDNGGGQIFSHLPVATLDLPKERWAFWESPPAIDLAQICMGYGVAHRLCESKASLSDSLRWAQEQTGTTMLQVKVGADSMRWFQRRLQDALV